MGRRFIRWLDGQLHHLRDHAQHGNRRLFFDQLVVAHLLAFFNPILSGLRKIILIYRHRWQVELFFRWLKCMANFKHFCTESPQGMTPQIYIALIGTLLMAIETGARPSSDDFALMSMAVSGLTPMEQILAQAAKRRAERARATERQRARKKKQDNGEPPAALHAPTGAAEGMRPAKPTARREHQPDQTTPRTRNARTNCRFFSETTT